TPANLLDVKGGIAIGNSYAGVNVAPANGAIIQGNVGIGTTGPADNLHIYNNANATVGITLDNPNTGSSSSERISFNNEDGSVAGIQMNDISSVTPGAMSIFNNRPSGNIRLITGGNSKVYIGNNGFVGIGPNFTAPAGVLHIKGADWSSSPVILEANGSVGPSIRFSSATHVYDIIGATGTGASTGADCWNIWDNTAGAYRFTLTAAGNVGIGVTAPSFQFQVATNSAGKPTSNTWTVVSDGRLKKDVKPYESGLNDLMQINPVWFTYTGEAGMPQETGVGVIAQDLQKIAPYMIKPWTYKDSKGGSSTEYLGVDNGAMTYMLINSVKQQQQQIEDLKKQLTESPSAQQQQQIDDLKKQLEDQQKQMQLLLDKMSQLEKK
ncbi:MAG: tail fiber domain-containing protein, partial [Bacteroidia bacterium]